MGEGEAAGDRSGDGELVVGEGELVGDGVAGDGEAGRLVGEAAGDRSGDGELVGDRSGDGESVGEGELVGDGEAAGELVGEGVGEAAGEGGGCFHSGIDRSTALAKSGETVTICKSPVVDGSTCA